MITNPTDTLKEVEYADNGDIVLHHEQDTSFINYETQLIKEGTDRGFSKGRHFQQFMRIPALEYVRLTKMRPELHDPNLMEKYVYSHDECIPFRIAENKRMTGQGLQLVIR